MKKWAGWSSVPWVCLLIAVGSLYLKPFILKRFQMPAPAAPILSGNSEPDEILTIHYHERPPYYVTGPLGVYGLCCDPVKKALQAAKIPHKWVRTPAARQLDIVKAGGNTACIGWFKNPRRDRYAVFSVPIYQDGATIALARSDNPKIDEIGTAADLLAKPDLLLLCKEGYSYGKEIDTMISRYHPRLENTTTGNIGMLKLVHAGLADYFFMAREEAVQMIETSGLLPENFTLIPLRDLSEGNKRYLLFSRAVSKPVIERINAGLRRYTEGV